MKKEIFKLSEEIRRRMSESHKGKKHSEEEKQKISESHKGPKNPMYGKIGPLNPKYKAEKHIKKIRAPSFLGKKHSEEYKLKMSIRMMGENNPNYGKNISKEVRKKMSEAHKRMSEETKKKISESHKGLKRCIVSEEIKKKISDTKKRRFKEGKSVPWNKGGHISENQKISISKFFKGRSNPYIQNVKNPNWHGGFSKLGYSHEFNGKLKESIRRRDGYRCQECFIHQNELGYRLSIHHIDFDKKNNNPDNLFSLCKSCHTRTTFNRENWIVYFKEKMKMLPLNFGLDKGGG